MMTSRGGGSGKVARAKMQNTKKKKKKKKKKAIRGSSRGPFNVMVDRLQEVQANSCVGKRMTGSWLTWPTESPARCPHRVGAWSSPLAGIAAHSWKERSFYVTKMLLRACGWRGRYTNGVCKMGGTSISRKEKSKEWCLNNLKNLIENETEEEKP